MPSRPLLRIPGALLGCVLAWLLATACDRRVEPYVPPDQEPPVAEKPVRIPGLGRAQPSREGAPTSPAAPPSLAAPDGPQPDDAAAIRGQIRLANGVVNPGRGALFVIARSSPAAGGPPLAVKRLPPGPFPMAFTIGPADVMIQGRPFRSPIHLSARVDVDANAMTRDPGDLLAELAEPLQPGARDVDLVLRGN